MKAWSVNDADIQGIGEGREEAKEQEKKKKHLLYLNFLYKSKCNDKNPLTDVLIILILSLLNDLKLLKMSEEALQCQ